MILLFFFFLYWKTFINKPDLILLGNCQYVWKQNWKVFYCEIFLNHHINGNCVIIRQSRILNTLSDSVLTINKCDSSKLSKWGSSFMKYQIIKLTNWNLERIWGFLKDTLGDYFPEQRITSLVTLKELHSSVEEYALF